MLKRIVSSGVLLMAGMAMAQENYYDWSYVKEITVNTTETGTPLAEGVGKYPLLVRLGSGEADVFTQAGTNGASLRFTTPNLVTRLPHSIDHWDAVNQSAAIWVLVDSVYANSATGVDIRMLWGKADADDVSDAGEVFTESNGFVAVWHLGGDDETVARSNSVAGGNPAVPEGFATDYTPVVGVIGSADTLTGGGRDAGAWLNLGQGYGNWNGEMTMSLWLKRDFNTGFRQFISLSNGTNDIPARDNIWMGHGGCCGSENRFTSEITNGTNAGGWTMSTDSNSIPKGEWNLLSFVVTDGDKVSLYSDGELVATRTSPQSLKDTLRTANHIGRAPYPDPTLTGSVDEVRFSRTARSASWHKLDFVAQEPGAAIVTLSATDDVPLPPAGITDLRYESGNTDAIDTLNLGAFTNANFVPTYEGLPDSFTVAPSLPTGFALDKNTGAISGSANAASSAELTVTAYAGVATTTRTIRLIVTAGIANLRYVPTNTTNRDTLTMQTGTAINLVPQYDGGPADSLKLTGNNTSLPAGITLNKTTGAITGTPTATFASNRTVTAYFGDLTTTRNIRIVVTLGPTSALNYTTETFSLNAGETFIGAIPSWSGRSPTSFTATPALPAGLSLNPQTGIITGTPTAAAANTTVTIRAANATDTTTKTLTFNIAAATADGAYATAWSGHADVVLNTTASGANVTGNVTNFPVLVRLGSADTAVFSAAHASGKDIRFTKANNTTRLPHQIDHWDKAGKSAAVWVLVDSVRGNNSTQSIRMHWGNSTASPLSNGNAVFDTANGYVAVWHLGNGDETALRSNAVAGGNPAIPEFFPEDYVAPNGIIGKADTLRGGSQATGDRLNLGTGYGNWGGNMTMSMWIKPHAVDFTQWNQYISLSNGQGQDNIWMGRQGNTNDFSSELYSGSQSGLHTHAEGVQVQGEWQLLSWTVTNGTEVALYRNGVVVATRTSDQPLKDTLRTMNHIGRAAWPDPTIEAVVDEARLAKVARSADWIKLEFENQKAAQKFVTIKVDSVPTSLASALTGGPALSFRTLQEGVLFNIRTNTAAKARIEILDMRGRTIWNRSLQATAGTNEVMWNGRAERAAGSGIYFVRMLLLDADNKPTHTLERKLPLAR